MHHNITDATLPTQYQEKVKHQSDCLNDIATFFSEFSYHHTHTTKWSLRIEKEAKMILEKTTHLGAKSENDQTKQQRQEKKADEESVSQNGIKWYWYIQ